MAGLIDTLHFALDLDDKKFNQAIEDAKKKVAELTGDVNINVNVQHGKVEQAVKKEFDKLQPQEVKIAPKVDEAEIKRLEDKLKSLGNALRNKQVQYDKEKELVEKTTFSERRTLGINPKQTENALINLKSEIAKTEAQLEAALKARELQVKLDVPKSEIQEVKNDIAKGTSSTPVKISVEVDKEAVRKSVILALGKIEFSAKAKVELAEKQEKVKLDVNKSVLAQNIRAALENTQFKIKALIELQKKTEKILTEVNKTALQRSVSEALKGRTYKVKALVELQKKQEKLQFDVNKNVLGKNVREALKTQTFKANLSLVVKKAEVQDAIRQAFAQAGLKYETTQSDVRDARIAEIQARSLNNVAIQQEKLNQLKAKGVDVTNKYTKARGIFNTTLTKSSNWATQFGNQITNAFSVYALERFARDLYTIGGEFQKQQIALQSMIGDMDKANAIFERTKDMAVLSPFTFSELSSYTKQMSAYGIEYENLYDTTKRLADISAGVGVDMGRLILAFGQVRSAAVLRGQELRQFTEAGIPLVNELAKAFSDMEGKAVSAGEVFDKISKREVSFDMVKDILFGMTDPGGRFYETQEKLAQSLAGKWSNLKDAWDIMIADMARDSDGVLSYVADVFSWMLKNWEKWVPLITAATVALGGYQAALQLVAVWQSITTGGISTVIAIGSALLGAGLGYVTYSSTIKDATERMAEMNAETEKSIQMIEEKSTTANRYLDTLSKTAQSEEEKESLLRRQKETLEVLRDMYEDIVQDVKLEELSAQKILDLRNDIIGATRKEREEIIRNRITKLEDDLDDARTEHDRLNKNILPDPGAGFKQMRKVGSKEEIEDASNAIDSITQSLSKWNKELDKVQNRNKKLDDEDLTGWRDKANELIKNTKIKPPKEDQSMLEYFDYLKKEYDSGKSEFERYANDNPITAGNKKAALDLKEAANRVNIGLGGASFVEVKEGEDPFAKMWKSRTDVINEAVKMYDKWRDLVGKDAAKGMVKKEDAFKKLFDGSYGFNLDLDNPKEAYEFVQKLLDLTKEKQKELHQTLGEKISDVNFNQAKKSDEARKAELKSMRSYLEEYGTLMQQKLSITEYYAELIAKAQAEGNEWEVKRLERERDAKIGKVEIEAAKQTIDWGGLFGNFGTMFKEQIAPLIKQLEEIAKSDEFKSSSMEDQKMLYELISNLRKTTTVWDGDIFRKVSEDMIAYQEALRLYNVVQNDSTATTKEKDEAQRKLSETTANLTASTEQATNMFEGISGALSSMSSGTFKGVGEGLMKLDKMFNKGGITEDIGNWLANGFTKLFGKDSPVTQNLTKALGSTGMVGQIISAILEILDLFKDGIGKFIADILDSILGAINKILDNILSGQFIEQIGMALYEGIGSIIDTITRAIGNILSFGALDGGISDWFQNSNADEVNKTINRLTDRNEILTQSIDDLRDEMEKARGTETVRTAEDAIKAQKEKEQNLLGIAQAQASYHNAHHSWGSQFKFTADEIKWIQANVRKGFSGVNDLWTLTPEEMKKLRSNDSIWQHIIETGKGGYGGRVAEDLSNYADQAGEIESIIENMSETLTTVSFDSFYDSFISSLMNMDMSAREIADDISKYFMEAMLSNFVGSEMMDKLKGWYDRFSDYMANDGILDEKELEELRKDYQDYVEEGVKKRDELANATGYTGEEDAEGGLSKGIQGVTEDTANLLGSYLNAIRADVSVKRSLIEKLIGEDVPKMNYLAEAQLAQLNQITQNTKRNADMAQEIRDMFNRVVDKGSNKLRV